MFPFMRLLQLLILLLFVTVLLQADTVAGDTGKVDMANTSRCKQQNKGGADLDIQCEPKSAVSESLSTKPKKRVSESDLEIAEKKLKQAAADRDSARKQYDDMVKHLRLNPEDHGAKRMVDVYEERLTEKIQVYTDIEQKVLLLRLKSRLN